MDDLRTVGLYLSQKALGMERFNTVVYAWQEPTSEYPLYCFGRMTERCSAYVGKALAPMCRICTYESLSQARLASINIARTQLQ